MAEGRWRLVALKEIALDGKYAMVGGPFGSKLVSRDYVPEGVPVLRGANLPLDREIALDDLVFVTDEKVERDLFGNLAYPGDIIATQRGTLGQIGLLPEAAESPYDRYVVSQSQMKLTLDQDKADNRFVYYALRSPGSVKRIQDLGMSSGVPHINLDIFRNFEIRLPDLSTQRAVASWLRRYDDLIENNRRRVEILEEMARLIYREWFVHFRFPGHEDVELVDSDLGPIPEGWSATELGDVAENFDRMRRPLSKMERAQMPGQFPYYGAAKVVDHVNDWIFDGEFLLFAEDGTVVTKDGFPVLQLVNERFWANNHTHILQGRALPTRFLWLCMAIYRIQGHITGAAQPKITQANLNRVPVVAPDSDTVATFMGLVDPMVDLLQVLSRQNQVLHEARDLLLPRLVSGELDVSELDLALAEAG